MQLNEIIIVELRWKYFLKEEMLSFTICMRLLIQLAFRHRAAPACAHVNSGDSSDSGLCQCMPTSTLGGFLPASGCASECPRQHQGGSSQYRAVPVRAHVNTRGVLPVSGCASVCPHQHGGGVSKSCSSRTKKAHSARR